MSNIHNKRQLASGISVIAIAAALTVASPAHAQAEFGTIQGHVDGAAPGTQVVAVDAHTGQRSVGTIDAKGNYAILGLRAVRLLGDCRRKGSPNCQRSGRPDRRGRLRRDACQWRYRRHRTSDVAASTGADGRDQHHSCANREFAAEFSQLPELCDPRPGRDLVQSERRSAVPGGCSQRGSLERPPRRDELQESRQPRRHVRSEFRLVRQPLPANRHPGISGRNPELRRGSRQFGRRRAQRRDQDRRRPVPRVSLRRMATAKRSSRGRSLQAAQSRISTASNSAASSAVRSSRAS